MYVSEIMTREVIHAQPSCPLDEVLMLFQEHGFRHLPVTDEGRLVGILSDRDLALATGWFFLNLRQRKGEGSPKSVEEVMRSEVRWLPPDATVREAAMLMMQNRISALPILDEEQLVGLVTTTDLLRVCLDEDSSSDWKLRSGATVDQWMTKQIHTVHPDSSMMDALDICKEAGVRHLPVVDGNRLVGMISDRDLRFGLGQEIASDQVAQNEGRMDLCITPVSALMATSVVSIAPEELLRSAAKSMMRHGFSALPVVEGRKLVGILAQTDILGSCC